eukprot:CAMPEP_0175076734 /NCGR_PEP_ID=MMETSP0052_2-20121109/22924_1 /TAXON_ID=51329 ORGANISM="Polytomella parva, Strain SAG 63-3" /NCGR_SAMPLE_ID=MMETSP0052_2 /ASSEMBLY_ACC=CAM_ASM_000194 /LENGTH=418 /DNA_ID=CAMNT_0016345971 /DNA_START=452 /DNA_END=1708 /DNA_ORIENTATION=-
MKKRPSSEVDGGTSPLPPVHPEKVNVSKSKTEIDFPLNDANTSAVLRKKRKLSEIKKSKKAQRTQFLQRPNQHSLSPSLVSLQSPNGPISVHNSSSECLPSEAAGGVACVRPFSTAATSRSSGAASDVHTAATAPDSSASSPAMWLVVGLGNPGDEYAATRHNMGFRVLDALASHMNLTFSTASPSSYPFSHRLRACLSSLLHPSPSNTPSRTSSPPSSPPLSSSSSETAPHTSPPSSSAPPLAVATLAAKTSLGPLPPPPPPNLLAEIALGNLEGAPILLVKPLTYMNRSGSVVSVLACHYNIPPARILVVFDDLDLPSSAVKLRIKGSHGGHNGMRSVAEHISGRDDESFVDFPRLRCGVGRPPKGASIPDYVLTNFSPSEEEGVKQALKEAVLVIRSVAVMGVEKAVSGVRIKDP